MDEPNEELKRLEAVETLLGEHRHTVIDGTSRLDVGTSVVQSFTDIASVTPRAEDDFIDITALAQAITFNNPSGTLSNFDRLIIRIKDNGTARAISWGTVYAAGGPALPTTTTLSKILHLGFLYNSNTSKYMLVASTLEP
jgi:hypothetical protein